MSYDIGFNFRETSGFVTDPASTTYSLSEAYPTTRGSVTFGFGTTDLLTFCRDRNSGIDARLAGLVQVNSASVSDQTFRIDVPASGLVAVSMAFGDATFGSDSSWQILDSDGTTVLASQTGQTTAGGEWRDATGVLRTSASDWTTNNAAVNVTLSGTIFYLKLIATAGVTKISHLRLYQSGGGATSDPAASSSRFNKSRHTFGTRR